MGFGVLGFSGLDSMSGFMCHKKVVASARTLDKVSRCILAYFSETQLQAIIVRKAPSLRYHHTA